MAHHRGFTLIELVAVIAILGAIATFGVASYVDLRTQANAARQAAWIAALTADVDGNLRIKSKFGNATTINDCNDLNTEIQAGRIGKGIPYGWGPKNTYAMVLWWGPSVDLWSGTITRGPCPTEIRYCALAEWNGLGGYNATTGMYVCACPNATCS